MFNSRCFQFVILFISFSVTVRGSRLRPQDSVVKVPNIVSLPTIDGHSDDACWAGTSWQEIDQVWMPYGGFVGASDYTGQYKVAWSDAQNLLYFVVEVTDDAFIDGYVSGGDYYNYDIVEVFIDEDKSGGWHRIDQGSENAENAFTYHISLDAPADGDTTNIFDVYDLAGFWQVVNYDDHFPELAMRKNGDEYTWEFSLAVYADSLDTLNLEDSRVDLSSGKIIGLSLAYCDNDVDDGERDNFFGSVEVAQADSNHHWENSDDYGTLQLIEESGIEDDLVYPEISFIASPNPFSNKTTIEFELAKSSKVKIDVLNVLGQLVANIAEARFGAGPHTVEWSSEGVPSGIYFCRMEANSFRSVERLLIIK